jgi:hypothetical protein
MEARTAGDVAFPGEEQPPSWRISSLTGTSRRRLAWSASHFCNRVKAGARIPSWGATDLADTCAVVARNGSGRLSDLRKTA